MAASLDRAEPRPPALLPRMPETSPRRANAVLRPRDLALLLLLSLLWGGSFLFNGIATRELPTLTIVACRVGLAALALWLAIGWLRLRPPASGMPWRDLLVMGAFNNVVPFCLIVWGQHHIAAGLASIINATTPLFAVLVGRLATQEERLTPTRIAGLLLGLAGVVVLVGGEAFLGAGQHLLAELAVLAAAVSYGAAAVFGRRFAKAGLTPELTAAGQVTGSTLLLLPVALLVDRPWSLAMPGAATIAAVLALALLATAAAYLLYFRLLATAGATNTAVVTILVPPTAIVLGALVLGERLEPRQLGGMALIALGLVTLDGRLGRALRTRVLAGG